MLADRAIVDAMTGDDAIAVRGLRKAYGDKQAVDGLDLDGATRARCSRCSGPNGAGKTTTVEILEGYRRRDGGEVTVLGVDPAHADGRLAARRVGIVLQGTGEFDDLRVDEVVRALRRLLPATPTTRPR